MNNEEEQRDQAKGSDPTQQQEQGFGELRHYVPAEILNVSFPGAVRGYDRHAVDAHIKRVNRLIAEIKVSSSPRMAVRHALEQTEQQVSGLLERARETADEITTSAHREAEAEADGIRAKAAELLVNANAEADATKTEAETDAVWEQRRQLLDQMRGMASRLVDLADAATDREPDEPNLLEALEPKTQAETDPRASDGGENDSTALTVELARRPRKSPGTASRNRGSRPGAGPDRKSGSATRGAYDRYPVSLGEKRIVLAFLTGLGAVR